MFKISLNVFMLSEKLYGQYLVCYQGPLVPNPVFTLKTTQLKLAQFLGPYCAKYGESCVQFLLCSHQYTVVLKHILASGFAEFQVSSYCIF